VNPITRQLGTVAIYTIIYIIRTNGKIMSLYPELRVMNSDNIPKLAIGILAIIAIFSIYIVGYDQGQLFSMVQGNEAFDTMWLHEFTHDIRHAAGFPCH
jgi:hypothetical protein